MGGGAEAALAAEAGRGVNPLHKRLPKGRPPKGETFKENWEPYLGTLTVGAMVRVRRPGAGFLVGTREAEASGGTREGGAPLLWRPPNPIALAMVTP